MLKIIHGADFHLDSPFSGLSPEQAVQRREEQRELLDRLAALARDRQADLVLLAGDLLDSERVYRETALALSRALGAIPCPVFISPGNHDFYAPRSVWTALDWPDNVHIFSSGALEQVDLPGCVLWGRAFTGPRQDTCPLEGLAVPDDGRAHIACLHGAVGPDSGYGPISPGDIAASRLDYLALGHIHQASGLQREGSTYWAYPGCPEGRGFDELGEKGALYVEVEPGHVTAQFVPLAKRRYAVITADISGPASALDAILEPVSLYEPVWSDSGDTVCVMDQVKDDKNNDEMWVERIALKEAVSHLTDRERKILSMRFFQGKTQMEVSAEIGISQAQVSRLEKNALRQIRKEM